MESISNAEAEERLEPICIAIQKVMLDFMIENKFSVDEVRTFYDRYATGGHFRTEATTESLGEEVVMLTDIEIQKLKGLKSQLPNTESNKFESKLNIVIKSIRKLNLD